MARKNQVETVEYNKVQADELTAALDTLLDEIDAMTVQVEPTYPVYAVDDKFTADDLYDTKGKQRQYSTVENAQIAQTTGKYSTRAVRNETVKPQGAPRKTGVQVSEIDLPADFESRSKAYRCRFLVESGVTMGDTARYMNVRFQQVYQAVSYGKRVTDV